MHAACVKYVAPGGFQRESEREREQEKKKEKGKRDRETTKKHEKTRKNNMSNQTINQESLVAGLWNCGILRM